MIIHHLHQFHERPWLCPPTAYTAVAYDTGVYVKFRRSLVWSRRKDGRGTRIGQSDGGIVTGAIQT